MHVTMAAILAIAGVLADVGPLYYLGVAFTLVLAWYENRQFDRAANVFVLNERVFVSNMTFSIAFLITTFAGFVWRP